MSDLYEKNIQLVSRKVPLELLKGTNKEKQFKILQTESSHYTALVKAASGAEIYLHSKVDPIREASSFVSAKDYSNHDAVVCLGFGLGYVPELVMEKLKSKQWLAFVESDVDLFNEALKLRDFTKLFSRENISFYVGRNQQEFLRWMRDFLNLTESEVVMILSHPSSLRKDPAFYMPLDKEIMASVNRRVIEVNTLVHYKEILDTNSVMNTPVLVDSPGFGLFKDKLAGIPAVVVASGPSLDLCVEQLKSVSDQAVIICVSRSLKILMDHGIIPHFVVHLDMSEHGMKFFENVAPDQKTVLVFDPDSYYKISRSYPYRKISYVESTNYFRWLKEYIEGADEMKKGLSVSHMGFYFADYVGCNPIALVGVDLALPTEETHAKGSAQTWGGKVDLQEHAPNLVFLDSVQEGKQVRSLKTFQSFVSVFEADILEMKREVINTSPFGARIRGTIEMSFNGFLGKLQGKQHKTWETIDYVFAQQHPFRKEEFKIDCRSKVKTATEILVELDEILKKLKRLYRLNPDNRYDLSQYQEISKLCQLFAIKILNDQKITPFLQRLLSSTALDIRKINRQMLRETDKKKKIGLEIKRLEKYLLGYKQSLSFFLKLMNDLLNQL